MNKNTNNNYPSFVSTNLEAAQEKLSPELKRVKEYQKRGIEAEPEKTDGNKELSKKISQTREQIDKILYLVRFGGLDYKIKIRIINKITQKITECLNDEHTNPGVEIYHQISQELVDSQNNIPTGCRSEIAEKILDVIWENFQIQFEEEIYNKAGLLS